MNQFRVPFASTIVVIRFGFELEYKITTNFHTKRSKKSVTLPTLMALEQFLPKYDRQSLYAPHVRNMIKEDRFRWPRHQASMLECVRQDLKNRERLILTDTNSNQL